MSTVLFSPAASDSPSSRVPGGQLSSRALWDWVGAGSLAALLACFSVADQLLTIGSSEGRWTYPYTAGFSPRVLAVALAATALSAFLLFGVGAGGGTRRDWAVVLAWIVFASGIQALIRSATPYTFERIFLSDDANSFYSVTRQFPASSVLTDFDRIRSSFPLHAQSNMPGKLMLVYALGAFSRAPATLAWLVVIVSNLGAALMYVFVRELFDDRRMAMYSAALYLLVPSKLYFFPLLNVVTPVIVLACATLLVTWLRTGKAVHAAALGLAVFGLVFFEPLPLVMGLLFALLVLRAVWLGQITTRQLLTHLGVGMAAWLAAYGSVRILLGFDLVTAFREIGGHAVGFNTDVGRPYLIWIWANLGEFFFGTGVCQAVVFWAALVDGCRRAERWRDRLTRPVTVLCAGLAAVLLATDVIGVNRGEVIRLWIFLSCFFQIPTAYVCARLEARGAMMLVMAVTILQATLGTAMIGFIVLVP